MSKKILIISPTPSHPQNAGNRARICSLGLELKKMGHEVHFLYDDQESHCSHVEGEPNILSMTETWDNFYYFSGDPIFRTLAGIHHGISKIIRKPFYLLKGNQWRMKKLFIPITSNTWRIKKLFIPITSNTWRIKKLFIPITSNTWRIKKLFIPITSNTWRINSFIIASEGRMGLILRRTSPGIYRRIKPCFPDGKIFIGKENEKKISGKERFKKNHKNKPKKEDLSQIDERYNLGLDKVIQKLHKEHHYNVAIAEYVFMSRALTNFDKNVLKIIDTHDVFTNRDGLHMSRGVHDKFFSTTQKEEAKGLNRADKIIAIQEKERDFLKKITKNNVLTVGHISKLHEFTPKSHIKKEILFVGTGNKSNIHGIKKFISEIFPEIKKEIKGVKLVLCGKICDFIEDYDGVIKLGEVGNLNPIYESSDVVINPVFVGTGLKIKNIESLSYNRPLITSRHGAEGMIDFGNEAFFIAESAKEYISILKDLFYDLDFYNESSLDARNYCLKYNGNSLKNLTSLLN